ncbi:hypothetical protein GCM10007874_08640 [Labrys miyagiensis]|uniref:PAC domain-containing protein n=1 Tax=Labrys miyagiensis TaxID=346912 RepID=A0ABQ6CGL2_9HYPH|nr:hypothetical protein GCM10007874_08640 [Labrys miyagiensis]
MRLCPIAKEDEVLGVLGFEAPPSAKHDLISDLHVKIRADNQKQGLVCGMQYADRQRSVHDAARKESLLDRQAEALEQ